MTDIEMLPCPFCGGRADIVRGGAAEEIWPHGAFSRVFCTGCQARQLFHKTDADAAAAWNTRANIAHATAAKDAEIERLRAEVAKLRTEVRERDASLEWWGRFASDAVNARKDAEARAERLAEALREKADKWDRIGDEHGVRQFTGNDHKLFANELRALLHDHDQEVSDEE